jgi:hypothetical protein
MYIYSNNYLPYKVVMNDLIFKIYSCCDFESKINLQRIFKYPFKINKLQKSRIQEFLKSFKAVDIRYKQYNVYFRTWDNLFFSPQSALPFFTCFKFIYTEELGMNQRLILLQIKPSPGVTCKLYHIEW